MIYTYDDLLMEFGTEVSIFEKDLLNGFKGAYRDGIILINRNMSETEKKCILAEELGHHFTSSGNILDTREILNLRQERKAHEWAVKKFIPLEHFLTAVKLHSNDSDRAEHLAITTWFLKDAYDVYKNNIVSTSTSFRYEFNSEFASELCF